VGEPVTIVAGGCASTRSPVRAAGFPQIITVGAPGARIDPGRAMAGGIATPGVVASPTRALGEAAPAGAYDDETAATVQMNASRATAATTVRATRLN
jgi:hypothetical protein